MRLLDFIEEYDRVGASTYRFRELPAFLIPYVSGRSANAPGNRMLLHVLAHIDPGKGSFIVEQKICQCFGKFCFPHTRRAEKEKCP